METIEHSKAQSVAQDVQSLEEQLNIHRRNLHDLERRKAQKGIDVDVKTLREVDHEQEEIARLESLLEKITVVLAQGESDSLDSKVGESKVADLTQTRPPEISPSVKRVVNGDLGEGIRMGGVCEGEPLELVSSDWRGWGDGWVKSGWFYMLSKGDLSHAVAFFKVHLLDGGHGYVHILAASNAVHTIWLETDAGSSERRTFKWGDNLDTLRALWSFWWKR